MMLVEVTRERPAVLPADRATLLVEHAAELVTLGSVYGDGPRGGLWQSDPGLIRDGAIAIGGDGRILAVGPTDRIRSSVDLSSRARVLDASGLIVVPGFVDAYAHAVIAGEAAENAGPALARSGAPGRVAVVRDVRDASEHDIVARLWQHLDAILLRGTTALALTSGYGLDPDDEVKLLRAVQGMTDVGPLTVVGSFRVGATIPTEYADAIGEYVELVAHDLIPDIADDELATTLAVVSGRDELSLEHLWRLLRAGRANGLLPRLDLGTSHRPGALGLAAEMGVESVVLLDAPDEADLTRLADMAAVVVLLPGQIAPSVTWRQTARRLIELGVPLALGTGYGPAGGRAPSTLDAIQLAVAELGLTPSEALVAATVNAAYASGLGDDVGSLEPGKRADLLLLNAPSYVHLPHQMSGEAIQGVVKDGWVVVEEGQRVA
ncbi:MAG: amidohydrolase family protein [Chloroflexi bacterium]|nr:amidohydrolase family protein [Chloroflexota bacterium]